MTSRNISDKKKIELATRKKEKTLKRAVRGQAFDPAMAYDRTDITDRIGTLEEIRTSEAKFREFFARIPDYCYIVSREGKILEVNNAALQALGYEKEELVGKPLMKIYAPEISSRVKALFKKWQETGQIINEEMVIITKNGERRIVLLNVGSVRNRHGTILHSTSVQTDITDLKQAGNALRDSEARLSLAADSAGAGLWSSDFKTGHIWATEQAHILYGFPPDENITYDKFIGVIHPDDRDQVNHEVRQAFRAGASFRSEYRIVMPDGSIRWIKMQAKAFVKPSGKPDRMMGVSLDISQRKQSEAEAARLRLELTHLSRVMAMNEISASLAHEINQPLGAILNNASTAKILVSQIKGRHEDINEILADIIQDARRASDIIRKVRGIVKKGDVQFEPLNMNTLIKEVVELPQHTIRINNVSLDLDLEPDLAKVMGDRIRLQQVLLNLITNALEAMSGRPLRILTIRSTMTAADMVTVSISDSGTGIDDAEKANLFEPFFTTKKDGLGMGLRISRLIVEEHGGRIWVENNPVAGVTFSFSLKSWRGEPA